MNDARDYLVWLGETEFSGGSFNGPALMETLRSLPLEEALSTDTYEGYSAWGVTLHTIYFKYLIGKELGAKMPSYDYEDKGWPAMPENPDQAAWDTLLDDLEAFHNAAMSAFKEASLEKLEEPMPGWKTSKGNAFAWVVSHDTNHNTQIRNMGLPSLKQK
ncbi:MAG: DinB family protein [Spirochaetales bacterium]